MTAYLRPYLPGRHVSWHDHGTGEMLALATPEVVGLFCLLRVCVALEYGLVSLGLHCFLRLARALYCCSRRCLAYVAVSM